MTWRYWWVALLLGCQPSGHATDGRDPRWSLTDYLHALEARTP